MNDHMNNGNPPRRPQPPHVPGPQSVAPRQPGVPQQARYAPAPGQPPHPQHVQQQQVYAHEMQPHHQADGSQPPKFIKPKRRSSGFVKLMQLMMSLVFFAAIGIAGFVMFTRLEVDKPGPLAEKAIFEVGKGQGLSTISTRLQKDGIITNKRIFAMHTVTQKAAKKLKAGKFSIPAKASMQEVLDILVRGRAIFYKVTIPEGLTSQQAVAILNRHPQLAGKITQIPAEGSLMPNTYQFDAGANRADILVKMARMQQDFITRKWPQRQKALPFKTPQEALILASIVEKETGVSSERRHVAGVFVNRLKKGMKLQSDPTIIYGLVGGKGKLGHPLRRSEMRKKTSYNTYQINGLPPTPIANPGAKAIAAVLNPADTKDLYFVADGTGGHAFAPTLKKHNQNVVKWRKIERKRRAEEKRREAEKKRLAALAKKAKPKIEKAMPGLTVGLASRSLETAAGGWPDRIAPPSRKPR